LGKNQEPSKTNERVWGRAPRGWCPVDIVQPLRVAAGSAGAEPHGLKSLKRGLLHEEFEN